jgi:hypothetical protein
MPWPKSTGELADFLRVSENRITLQIRLGKIQKPGLMFGRRAWSPIVAREVAHVLGIDDIAIRNEIEAAIKTNEGCR